MHEIKIGLPPSTTFVHAAVTILPVGLLKIRSGFSCGTRGIALEVSVTIPPAALLKTRSEFSSPVVLHLEYPNPSDSSPYELVGAWYGISDNALHGLDLESLMSDRIVSLSDCEFSHFGQQTRFAISVVQRTSA